MARPYATEISKLSETFAWAADVDVASLRQAIRTAGLSALRAVGSGGSLTAAQALASFHQRHTGRIATAATPLEAVAEPLDSGVGTWLLSAGGYNVDVIEATRAAIRREPRQLAVLCGREDSPLAALCRDHPFVDLLIYPNPAGKDGFLATNSLLGFTALLARAYALEYKKAGEWESTVELIASLVAEHSDATSNWERLTAPLWARPTTLVLHGPATRVGAVDLESKFTEAALGNLQLADYRNFAHGRHHWLAKRGEVSAVVAFVTDGDRVLADRTLALIPSTVPVARIEFRGGASAATLASLVAALKLTAWAGSARGIDPGRPGVPEFGRRMYNLRLPRVSVKRSITPLSERDAVAITRKAGLPPERLEELGELERWLAALNSFRQRLAAATFAGMVLDYDGTIVDTRRRFFPPEADMAEQLSRIAKSGAYLAVATGRGSSVRRDLRARLPSMLWPRVLVGYYNGAEVALLDNDASPDGSEQPCEELVQLAAGLRAQPELADAVSQTDRRFQITLEAKRLMPENRLWDLAHQVLLMTGHSGLTVTRSSHSIDIVAAGVSKLNVVTRLGEHLGSSASLLTIGDRGRWPGNDYELLREPFALGVDEISVDPLTCWNLASPGQRGPAATLGYLAALQAHNGVLRFDPEALK